MELLSPGGTYSLIENTVYALPTRACLYTFVSAGGTLEISLDNDTWFEITLDENNNFQSAGTFIRCVDDDGVISVGAYTINSVTVNFG